MSFFYLGRSWNRPQSEEIYWIKDKWSERQGTVTVTLCFACLLQLRVVIPYGVLVGYSAFPFLNFKALLFTNVILFTSSLTHTLHVTIYTNKFKSKLQPSQISNCSALKLLPYTNIRQYFENWKMKLCLWAIISYVIRAFGGQHCQHCQMFRLLLW